MMSNKNSRHMTQMQKSYNDVKLFLELFLALLQRHLALMKFFLFQSKIILGRLQSLKPLINLTFPRRSTVCHIILVHVICKQFHVTEPLTHSNAALPYNISSTVYK